MKKNNNYFLILFSFFLLISCGSDDSPDNGPEVVPPQTKDISFSFDVAEISNKDAHKNKGVNETLLNKVIVDAVSVVITIQNESNTIIYNREKLDLTKVNDTYISSSISLDFGSYTITEFIVLDAQDNAIYLTPKDGSDMASNVTEALPISLTIGTSSDEQITFKVLDTNNLTADDFGYVSFDFEILNYYSLVISATIYNSETESFELSSGVINIKGDGNAIYSGSLNPEEESYPVLKGYTEYTIQVEKEGYETITRELTIEDIENSEDEPYKLGLFKNGQSIYFVSDLTEELKTIEFYLATQNDLQYVFDWGDGAINTYTADLSTGISHDYDKNLEYTIRILGNIEAIYNFIADNNNIIDIYDLSLTPDLIQIRLDNNLLTDVNLPQLDRLGSLSIFNNQLSSIDVSKLTNLYFIGLSANQLTSIDISENTELTTLSVFNNQLSSIDISNNTKLDRLFVNDNLLTNIDISNNQELYQITLYDNEFDVEAMETIYSQLLNNVSSNNIINGTILSQDNATASQAIIDIANELTNDYNWEVTY